MLEKLAKKYIEEANFGKKEAALFYLGAMVRPLIDTKVGDKAFAKTEFGNNIKALYSQAVLKLADLDLEKELAWAMKGFLDNYSDEVEAMEQHIKQFYLVSGAAFYGTLGACVDAHEWITAAEAAQRWGLGESTIRSAINRKQFEEGEYRKSGGVWLVRESAMKKLYGEPKKKLDVDAIEAILEVQGLSIDYESFESGDELADYLDGMRFPGFDEPLEVDKYQREALREIYNERRLSVK